MRATLQDYRRAFGLLVKKAVRPAFILPGQHTALLRRIAAGRSDDEPNAVRSADRRSERSIQLAAALHLSTCTVNNHRDHILRKLGLPCRTAAAAWYFQQLANLPAWACLLGQTLSATL